MRPFRARLTVLVLLLLTQQALALAVSGALACCETEPPAGAMPRMECCEKAGSDHICPLMNRRAVPDRGCRMKSGCKTESAGVLAGAGFVYAAPLITRFSMMPPPVSETAWRPAVETFVAADLTPPSPPPKV
jgi:hypothetical protein